MLDEKSEYRKPNKKIWQTPRRIYNFRGYELEEKFKKICSV